jgi:hypothetical protein
MWCDVVWCGADVNEAWSELVVEKGLIKEGKRI